MSYGKIRQTRIVAGPAAVIKVASENSEGCSLTEGSK